MKITAKIFDTSRAAWLNFRLPMKTFSAKAEQVERKWYIIDADNQVVGHVAEKAAVLLRGKHKAIFTSHVDTGDYVIVINAEKAVFTGKKETQKEYMSYSGFIGGHHTETAKSRRGRHPEIDHRRRRQGHGPAQSPRSFHFKQTACLQGLQASA